MRPADEIGACLAAHRRMLGALTDLNDNDARAPSLLPGWKRAHVLAHLADKSRTHVWLMGGAELDEVREQYPRGYDHAQGEVEVASGGSLVELRADVADSFAKLEAAWQRLPDDRWDRLGVCVPGQRTMAEIVGRHLRDVEVHLIDLNIGYGPLDWSEYFVEYELEKRLAGLPQRAPHALLLAWLLDRAEAPELGPW